MAAGRANVTLIEVPGVGHAPMLTEPEAFEAIKMMPRETKEIGFTGGEMDPCLFWRKSNKGTCYIA